MNSKSAFAALSALLLVIAACNVPLSTKPLIASDLLATISDQARTLQAAIPITGRTATPLVPQISVTSPTNCRTGPQATYALVFVANPGTTYRVAGRYTPGNYWIIENPAGGTCWLWGQYAVISGNVASVPELAVTRSPATATHTPELAITGPSAAPTTAFEAAGTMTPTAIIITQAPPPPPNPPTSLKQSRTCTSGMRGTTATWLEDITLTWRDTNGEAGYRIYQNSTAISVIAQNSMSYQIELRYDQGASGPPSDNFGVEAYNSGGSSAQTAVDVPRCP